MSWSVAALQIAAFGATGAEDGLQLFTAFAGTSPEQFNRPAGQTAFFVASATVNDVAWTLNGQQGRIDMVMHPTPSARSPFPTLPFGLREGVQTLLSKAIPIVRDMGRVDRLAIVASLLDPADTEAAAFREAIADIGLKAALSDGSDLQLQINRRRLLPSISDMRMNRLIRIGLSQAQNITFGATPLVPAPTADVQFAKQLIIDVNTVPEPNRPIAPDEIESVLRDLADEAERIEQRNGIEALGD